MSLTEILDRLAERYSATGVFARFNTGLGPVLLFGFAAHVATAIAGMVSIPFYLEIMGSDAYGIFGFYLVLQAWMLLFDLGVGQAVGRQLSRFRAGALSADDAVSLLGTAEALFLTAGVLAGFLFFGSMGWVARYWLGSSHLPIVEVRRALQLAGWLLVFRWLAVIYQNALIGLERQIAVNAVALTATVARNAGAIAALLLVANTPTVFFSVWLLVTILEAAANRWLLARAMPRGPLSWRPGWRLLTREFGFAAGLTFSTAVNLTITQADKMTLSHSLPLGQFGAFSLVVSLCGGIALVVPPMVQAFQPRLTSLLAQDRRVEFAQVYQLSVSLVIVVIVGLAGTIAAWPELVLYAWTGNRDIARGLAPTLSYFAVGSGIASFLYLPLVLQFAQGFIRLQAIGNLIFGAVWVPAAIWGSLRYGTLGAGVVWLLGNLLFVVLWVPVIHRRLLSKEERRDLGAGVWLRLGALAAILLATRLVDAAHLQRIPAIFFLAVLSLAMMGLATLFSRDLRTHLFGIIGLPKANG